MNYRNSSGRPSMKCVEKGIYKRGPYQFQVKIRRNGASVSGTFESLNAARRFRDVQTGKVVGDEYVDTRKERRTTLSVILERYLKEVTPRKKGARQEANRIKTWLKSDLASYSISGIDHKDIADWIAAREAEGKASTTVSNPVNILSAVFKKAKEWGYKIDNPCTGVSRPTASPPRVAVMNESEQALLLKACDHGPAWLTFVVRLALTTGMRQGEIRRLHWDHIFEDYAHLPATKNGTTRDVPLTYAAASVIDDIRQALPRRLDGWVFGHPDRPAKEGGFTEWQVQQAFRRASEYAAENYGLKRCTFHDIRHVSLTALAEIHTDVIDLQKTSGHKTLSVLSRYLNETPQDRSRKLREREIAKMSRW
ncbi:MAG TPA: hypothetical protein DCY26_03360, partial [Hyphomonas sp.]|nr:hypothetical protein [Hyphomonas sp.]